VPRKIVAGVTHYRRCGRQSHREHAGKGTTLIRLAETITADAIARQRRYGS
jgi:hypothetical protein